MVSYTNNNNSQEITHQYDLNSLQKSSKIIKKPPTIASNKPQLQPKVYKVQPIHFRELVQKLTGAQPGTLQPYQPPPKRTQNQTQTQIQHARQSNLQRVAPPPLPINSHHFNNQTQIQTRVVDVPVSCKVEQGLTSPGIDQRMLDNKREAWEGITELTLSPNFQAWFNFAMLSPGPAPMSH